ncbi:hypothetical protein COCVIDRAFT_21227 [Bipolaris victoriae FI3]|uniref:Heterokaryon incompatibility domain-containing protein n=1 Tax=Bipolaris victoriae (strain FI3) TaxID=930091 RepID=W7E0U8_BIPV3|nr:hypothetical protein COCVIDRAFT_21227 [Bipolaris victoriae FI3]
MIHMPWEIAVSISNFEIMVWQQHNLTNIYCGGNIIQGSTPPSNSTLDLILSRISLRYQASQPRGLSHVLLRTSAGESCKDSHPLPPQRDDHDDDGDLEGLGGPAQPTTETPRSQSSFSQDMIDALLSDEFTNKFDNALDELPKGDYRQAKGLFMIGGQFNLYYTRTASPMLLDNAISYTERALEKLHKSHEELKEYSNVLEVAEHRLEVTDQYISGLKLGIRYLEECSLKEEKKRELGCAYWSRFWESNNVEDLALAIETLEACFENPEKTFPQAAIYLGSALRQRYDYEKSPNDLDRSVELLRKGLEAVPRDENHYGPLRAYALGVLTSTCAKINNNPYSGEIRSRAINSVEIVLSSTPPEIEAFGRLRKQYLNLVMTQCFKEAETVQELLDTLEFGLDDKLAENQDNMAVVEVPPTTKKLFTLDPLLDGKKNIRLVKLLPGTKRDVIQCEIFVERLGGALHYEALSCVWGSPIETEEICVNGCLHEVTKNLYSALLRLLHTETISLMRDIYQSASTVIMWLGEPKSEEQSFAPMVEKADQTSERCSKSLIGERSSKFKKAEAASENEPHISEHRQMQECFSDVPVPPLSPEQSVGTGQFEALMENFMWLQPILFGCKPMSMIPDKGSPGFMSVAEDLVKKIEQEQKVNLLFHNIRIRRLPGHELHVFDWTSPDNIISFFRSPQSASTWPTLGAFALIHSFAQFMHFSELPFFGGSDTNLSYPSTQTWIKSASELDRILTSEYWQRAWILQELEGGFKKFKNLYLLRRAHGASSMFSADSPLSEPSSHNALSSKPNLALSLSSIMGTGIAKRRATHPRDLVYGILGLVDGDIGIEEDYTASLAEVFTRAVVRMIREKQSFQVLILNDLGRHTQHGLPSWVPDWTSDGMFCPQPYPDSLYQTDKGRQYYAEIEDELKLKVRSIKVDTIKRVSKMRTVSWNNPGKLVGLLKEWRCMVGLDSPTQQKGHDHANLEDTFWKTVFADMMLERDMEHRPPNDWREDRDKVRRFEPRDMVKVQAWWNWLQREADSNFVGPELEWYSLCTRSHPDRFHIVTDSFWHTTETRKMIFAESGRMGTGPSEFGSYIEFRDARVGDEVHVLFGLSVPVILRVLEDGEERPSAVGTKRYRFVGPCYLHGIMDGEAVEDGNEAVEEIFLC